MLQQLISNIKSKLNLFDYTLLIFIIMMSQDRIPVKLAAIIFIFILRFNLKFGLKDKRLPLFYLFIIAGEVVKYFLMGNLYLGNWATVLVSSLYWGMSFLALHQVKLSIEKNGYEKSENTLKAFTLLNFAVCIGQFIHVMILTHSLNPYSVHVLAPDIRFPDVMFPYGQSSGDQIRGIFYDNHINAIASQLCFIFFIYNRKYLFAFLTFVIIAVICFNLVTLTTLLALAVLFFVLKEKKAKLFISSLVLLTALFYAFVTPENAGYLRERILKSASSAMSNEYPLIAESKPVENKPVTVDTNVKSRDTQTENTPRQVIPSAPVVAVDETLLNIDSSYNFDKVSGKRISYTQTLKFLKTKYAYTALGSGAGMFSSKLANNFSGVFYGPTLLNKNLPVPSYKVFNAYHGSLYRYIKGLEIGKHSINNFPNGVYDQLLSEYGLVGLILFFCFYIGFFVKRFRQLTFGLVLIPLLLIGFNYGYFFESLDITIFFEFLMFLDLSKKSKLS
ncbi:hypothetical protein CNR22_19325 [Sphingobacteriaceae bacterium]|nr:hypothetical protein CNR22_19325 [Sphingobacteriaceae bacterium]